LKKRPVVTVVTPSLNQGVFIGETIESVLAQEYEALNYWVVDGRSSDNTLAILQSFDHQPNFHFASEADEGQAAAIHKGWQRGQGDILAWLNTDDLYRPNAISRVAKAFVQNPDAVMVCGSAALIDEAGRPLGRIDSPYLDLEKILALTDFLPQPAVFMQAEAVRAVGGLNTTLDYAFDFDLFLRLAAFGSIHYLEEELAAYRWHEGAKTASNYYHLRREAAQVARNFLQTKPGQALSNHRHLLSYSHLVEGYANWRLGRKRPFLSHTIKGIIYSPGNIHWIFRRLIKHLRQRQDSARAYPYDPALS
jgi:glycosyltransferase involved in cell wall biosynthesis